MTIGILTFYNYLNFGANLQGVSTYLYLKKHGHNPIFINYKSEENYEMWLSQMGNRQLQEHLRFVNGIIENQTAFCHNQDQLLAEIKKYKIEAIIVGSDAVLQHHPLISRIKIGKSLLPRCVNYLEEQMFPNLFWGIGFSEILPCAMMSVSSQNSEYMHIGQSTKSKMAKALLNFRYISVRDSWTHDMVKYIAGIETPVTPDPVFAFNVNASEFVHDKEYITEKHHLPDRYVLVSLKRQSLPVSVLDELKVLLKKQNVECVALTMPNGVRFTHHFNYSIELPLSPDDWYSVIKNASAYVGSNMHPIVVSLHNAVPCVSIDNWGRTNIFGKKVNDGSSKVEHIMKEFGVEQNHRMINGNYCDIKASEIVSMINEFPIPKVKEHAIELTCRYNQMMQDIINSFTL